MFFEASREHHESPLRPALPVADRGEKRLHELDVLRGVAMFGVLFVNVMVFTGDAGYGEASTSLDRAIAWVRDTTFNGKAYLILAMVFGYSLGLQMRTAGALPARRRALTRRLFALAALGFAHGVLLYRYDILFAYGVLGYIAHRSRRLSTRTLLAVCGALTVLGAWSLLSSIDTRGLAPVGPAVAMERYRNGSLAELIGLHVRNHLANVTGEMTRQWPFAMVAILLGVLAERHNLVGRLKSPSGLRVVLRLVGLTGTALLCFAALPIEVTYPRVGDMIFQAAPLAFAVGLATTVAASHLTNSRAARAVAQLGRMSLSVYLMQSAVCTTLLYGFGFGLARHFTPSVQLVFTVAFFSLQVALCHAWMRTRQRGPVEELVRRWSSVPARRVTRPVVATQIVGGSIGSVEPVPVEARR